MSETLEGIKLFAVAVGLRINVTKTKYKCMPLKGVNFTQGNFVGESGVK